MDKLYRSKYEAYPFLADAPDDLRCDFEVLTDRVTSLIGLLRSLCNENDLRDELLEVGTLLYHANPTLRTKLTITQAEVDWLSGCVERLRTETAGRCEKFVLPQGSPRGSVAHVLRADGKQLVRLLYRHAHAGNRVDDLLFDFANLLSGYFFMISLKLNTLDGVDEIPFISRNY
ncbi:MAG: ATP--cob(I)alamin adenosyltransferase [Oscillospiraceae bacterium]|jgi:ATP:cob(I)alamin adenosyltransferase|nr:ATP--cob(I)alamin adenosyltransferase [Oscillospiraceae bacterium]